jgi:hypothetical protein
MLQLQYFLAPAFKPLTTGKKEQVNWFTSSIKTA